MASTPTDPGGQDNNKNIANCNNKMDADTTNHPMDSDTEETPSNIPWSLENWRLDIRTPPKKKNDNSSHAFSPVTAFKNFLQATLAFKDTAIRFHSLSNDTDFIDSSTASFPTDDTLTEQYMRGALGRFEHGTIKYFLQFRVGFQSTSFDSIKACLLPYLQFHNSWLAQNSFPTLEIYAAGAFSLCHPHWTRLHDHHKAIRDLILTHIDSIDLTLLTPDQRTSLEPLLADQTIPHFELHIQAIRAHLPVETTAPSTKDADTYSKPEDSKPSATVLKTSDEFIVTDCIELRCEKQFTEFFCTALESATANDVWAVGRFFNHMLRFDSPELHFACISEQHLFAKNTSYIQIQWAHPIALLSQVNFHTIPAFSNLEEPPSLPTLPQFMQTLQGTLPNDQMKTPQFFSLEQTYFKGTWKLLCHRELLQDNRAWFDDHFLTLYQRTTGYQQLTAEVPRFKAPHRRDDRYDRVQRAQTRAHQGQLLNVHIDRSKLVIQTISNRRKQPPPARRSQGVVLVDTSHFSHLQANDSPWQLVSRNKKQAQPKAREHNTQTTALTPQSPASPSILNNTPSAKPHGKTGKKQVRYADATSIATNDTSQTALTTPTFQVEIEGHISSITKKLSAAEATMKSHTAVIRQLQTQLQTTTTNTDQTAGRTSQLETQTRAHRTQIDSICFTQDEHETTMAAMEEEIHTHHDRLSTIDQTLTTHASLIQHNTHIGNSTSESMDSLRELLAQCANQAAASERRCAAKYELIQDQLNQQAVNLNAYSTRIDTQAHDPSPSQHTAGNPIHIPTTLHTVTHSPPGTSPPSQMPAALPILPESNAHKTNDMAILPVSATPRRTGITRKTRDENDNSASRDEPLQEFDKSAMPNDDLPTQDSPSTRSPPTKKSCHPDSTKYTNTTQPIPNTSTHAQLSQPSQPDTIRVTAPTPLTIAAEASHFLSQVLAATPAPGPSVSEQPFHYTPLQQGPPPTCAIPAEAEESTDEEEPTLTPGDDDDSLSTMPPSCDSLANANGRTTHTTYTAAQCPSTLHPRESELRRGRGRSISTSLSGRHAPGRQRSTTNRGGRTH